MPDYPVPLNTSLELFEVKKSRFHGRAGCVTSRSEAMAMLAAEKQQYPDARHHCWAYVLGSPTMPISAAMSDDGEPSGTAGKPILNIIQHSGIGDIMVVVSRYFGGTKLGAGGMIRAYSSTAKQAVEALQLKQHIAQTKFEIRLSFQQEQAVRHRLTIEKGLVMKVVYDTAVTMQVTLPMTQADDFTQWCNNQKIQIYSIN